MLPQPLIRLLADGQFHSGEVIGKSLGVSRTAVWKQLKKLSPFGLHVESVKGRGYRLVDPLELLEPEAIRNGLSERSRQLISELHILPSVTSTNDLLLENTSSNDKKGCVCFAEHQSLGRGRRGRQWVSPYGRNLYFSVIWNFDRGAALLEGLSLAVGVAVARAITESGGGEVKLKWPNDILYHGKKLGGVLLEMIGDPTGECQVVIGVGINVHMNKCSDIGQPWMAMNQVAPSVSRNQLAATILNQLMSMLEDFSDVGFSAYQEEWSRLDAFKEQSVMVISGSRSVTGLNAGVMSNGALLLNVDGTETVIHGGELSLRRVEHDS